MINVIRGEERYHFANHWLSTYWHFSFDQYYDPNNVGFGPLRVFNDDRVRPGSGFPTHAHREMEIITYVLEGELEHKDSTGGVGRIGAGEVQRMTAGTGIRHSEYNPSMDAEVHLLQMWLIPAVEKLPPSYEQKQFTAAERASVLLPVASGSARDGAVKVHQDATIFVATLRPGDAVSHALDEGRRAYVFVVDGQLGMNGAVTLAGGDQARIENETKLDFAASETSEIVLLDLP